MMMASTENLCQQLRRGDIEAETDRALGGSCGFEATASVGIAGEMVGEMCNKREEMLEAMTMLTTIDDDDDVSRGSYVAGEASLQEEREERRDVPWVIDGRAGLETRNLLPVDKQVMTSWKKNGGSDANH